VRIISHWLVKGRGGVHQNSHGGEWAVAVRLEAREPKSGKESLRRVSDGQSWLITGVEWWAIPRRPGSGDPVGLALRGEECPKTDDEVEIVYEGEE
jgi:hypothetical protein